MNKETLKQEIQKLNSKELYELMTMNQRFYTHNQIERMWHAEDVEQFLYDYEQLDDEDIENFAHNCNMTRQELLEEIGEQYNDFVLNESADSIAEDIRDAINVIKNEHGVTTLKKEDETNGRKQ